MSRARRLLRTALGAFAFALAVPLLAAPAALAQDSGVCDRTEQVRDELTFLADRIDCADVTDADLAGITELSFRLKDIASLKADDFAGLTNLTELDLDGNDLTALPEDVFSGLTSLSELYLNRNDLTALPASVFSGLSSLSTLDLAENGLTALPQDVFSGLTNLSTLRLEVNDLATLPESVFTGLSSLRTLSLRNNGLTALPANVFSGLTNLGHLKLEENGLTALPVDVFSGLTRLHTLRLRDNDLTALPAGVFADLTSLRSLNLIRNSGAPFTLMLELARTDAQHLNAQGPAQVAVRLAEGAPFEMIADLSVAGGTLSAATATLAAGMTESGSVTATGAGQVTVSLGDPPEVPAGFYGIRTAVGPSLVLFEDNAIVLGVDPELVEEDSGSTQITVTASFPGSVTRPEATVVSATVADGTATAGEDFTAVTPFSVTIPANESSGTATFTLTVDDDNVSEGGETLTVQGTQGMSTVTPATVTIADNDAIGIIQALRPTALVSVQENGVGAEIDVTMSYAGVTTRSTDTDIPCTVSTSDRYTTVDPFTVTIPALETEGTATFTLEPIDNDLTDGPKSVHVVCTIDGGGFSFFIANIVDDETPTAVDLEVSPARVAEDGGNRNVTVTASFPGSTEFGGPRRPTPTVVAVSVTGGTATAGEDFTAVAPFSVTIPANAWRGTGRFSLTVLDDDVNDGEETVKVTGTTAGLTVNEAVIVIADDEGPPLVSLALDPAAIGEDGGVSTVTASLSGASSEDTTVTVTAEAVAPAAAGHFTLSENATLSIAAGETESTGVVTVTAVNDEVAAPDKEVTVSATAVNDQGVTAPADVTLTIEEDDAAGITVTLPQELTSLTTTEAGGQATFTVALDSEPTADVSIGVSSDDLAEGTVEPATLTFTASDYAAKTVTVTGVDDDVDDGDVTYSIVLAAATSTDTNYSGFNPDDVSVVNIDDDNPPTGVVLSLDGDTQTTGEQAEVDEGGGEQTVTVKASLTGGTTRAEATIVTVTVAAGTATETTDYAATVADPFEIEIPAGQASETGTFTVTPVDDAIDEPGETVAVTGSTAAAVGLPVTGADLTITDDDTAGITVTAIDGDTTEAGGEATFTVALDSEPTADVSIGVSSDDLTEGTVAPATLTFTASDYAAKTVTVTGVDDAVDDGDRSYTIKLAAAESTDTNYGGADPDDVSVTNTDDDAAGVTVTLPQGLTSLTTTEAGGEATFTVALDSAPTADASIGVSSDDLTEGTVAPATLTFTTGNWNTAQTVTVTGVDDAVDDGDQGYTIVLAAATSTDTNYGGTDPDDVSVTNTDDDTAGIAVTLPQGETSLTTTEAGGEATFTVALDSAPTADVSIGVSSDDTTEGTVAPATLTFTTGNWNTAQTVTVTGVDDAVDDGDQGYTIVLAAATSTDANYGGTDPGDVSVTNTDDDAAGITVTLPQGLTSLTTTEAGGEATFTVALDSVPTADVSIAVSSDDTGEGTVAPASLEFTPDNWNTAQTVTVTGVDDAVDDGDQGYTIVLAAAPTPAT